MQPRSAALTAHLAAGRGIIVRYALWLSARNRSTGGLETLGLWTGDDHAELVIDGQLRTYYGAGGLVQLDALRASVGTDIQATRVVLAPMAPEVAMAVRGYEPRQAPVEIHRLILDPETLGIVGEPVRRLRGWIDGLTITTAENGSEGRCELTLMSSARAGTKTLALKRSDESQKLRLLPSGGPDRFYRYADVSGAAQIKWGSK